MLFLFIGAIKFISLGGKVNPHMATKESWLWNLEQRVQKLEEKYD